MEIKSTRYYMLLLLSISGALFAITFIAVYLEPKSIYLVSPIAVVISYTKPVRPRISLRIFLSSFVYLIIGSFFAYLIAKGNDALRGTLVSLFMALLYLGYVKDRDVQR